MMMDYEIDYIGNRQQYINEIALLWAKEWIPEANEADVEKKIFKFKDRVSTDKPPFVLVAHKDNILIGSAGLSEHDLDRRPDLTPWLIGVLVKPEYRKQGIATDLIQSVLKKANNLGYKRIYLHTEEAHGLYEKLGWIFLEHTINDQGLDSDIYFFEFIASKMPAFASNEVEGRTDPLKRR